jgi:N-acetylmuramic acid 6-phosphate etherase
MSAAARVLTFDVGKTGCKGALFDDDRRVAEVTGADAAEADKMLGAADGQVKTAIVALLSGVGVDEARERLARADGRVRDAVGKAGAQ